MAISFLIVTGNDFQVIAIRQIIDVDMPSDFESDALDAFIFVVIADYRIGKSDNMGTG